MGNEFDEARAASEAMFSNENINTEQPTEDVTDAQTEEVQGDIDPVEESLSQSEDMIRDATQTAETAAQTAVETNAQLQQALQQIQTLQAQNSQLQGTIDELSNRNQEHIIEEALQPPVLDVNSLAFADEATVAAAQAKYAEDMTAYNRAQIMKELSPALEYAKQGMREKEKNDAISVLANVPELSGIKEILPQLDRIIANNKWLQSDDMPMDEKYINAFAIAKGVNSINNPPVPPEPAKEPTTEELMAIYNSNPDFQAMVEKQRLEAIKQSQQVPTLSGSSGAVNAALNIKEKPTTFAEASKRTREMFGL